MIENIYLQHTAGIHDTLRVPKRRNTADRYRFCLNFRLFYYILETSGKILHSSDFMQIISSWIIRRSNTPEIVVLFFQVEIPKVQMKLAKMFRVTSVNSGYLNTFNRFRFCKRILPRLKLS
jgi:hypothetical protein